MASTLSVQLSHWRAHFLTSFLIGEHTFCLAFSLASTLSVQLSHWRAHFLSSFLIGEHNFSSFPFGEHNFSSFPIGKNFFLAFTLARNFFLAFPLVRKIFSSFFIGDHSLFFLWFGLAQAAPTAVTFTRLAAGHSKFPFRKSKSSLEFLNDIHICFRD